MSKTPVEIWNEIKTKNPSVPEPGDLPDVDHGLLGDAERLPMNDASNEEDMS